MYVFLSNIDNLGATVDLNILNFLHTDEKKPEFILEVCCPPQCTPKAPKYKERGIYLQESAFCLATAYNT